MNMPKITIWFGGALVVMGVGGYVASGAASVTALIPAFFGILLAALGGLARRESLRRPTMHAAALVGLLGFLGSVSAIPDLLRLAAGGEVVRPMAVIVRSLMAVLTGVYVALGGKSFLDARRRRATGQK